MLLAANSYDIRVRSILGSSQRQMSSGYLGYAELKAASFLQDNC